MKRWLSLIFCIAAPAAFADDTRQLGAHEHGVGVLNIALDKGAVLMEFQAPGADIVGFEYAPKSDVDQAAIDAALGTLAAPLQAFVWPEQAGCRLLEATAEIEGGEDNHDDHEDHDDGEAATHTEFHAEYQLSCDDPSALKTLTFAYFDLFPNAQEIEVQMITAKGAKAFEVTRGTPVLVLNP